MGLFRPLSLAAQCATAAAVVVVSIVVAHDAIRYTQPEAHAAEVVCTPRPPVQVAVTEREGSLDTTFTATALGTGNAIVRTVVQQATNGRVEIAADGRSARIFPLVSQDATTVQFIVTDACGDWPTLAGRGARHEPTPTATATRTPSSTGMGTPTAPPTLTSTATATARNT